MPFTFGGSTKKQMRKIFTPLLLIPGFITFFACSKNQTSPAAPAQPLDSTAPNLYLDPGTVTAAIGANTFSSFNLIHAADSGGFVFIMARALVNNDTCVLDINFPDTLRTGIAYANYNKPDTVYTNNDSIVLFGGASYFNTTFFDAYKGIVYLSGVNNHLIADTLMITNFDKSKHLLAGTFLVTLTAGTKDPYIIQTYTGVTGSFNTYYNTAK